MEKRFDDIRSLLQVSTFIRVSPTSAKGFRHFGDYSLLSLWGHLGKSHSVIEVMQQPFFKGFVNIRPDPNKSLLEVAARCQNIKMMKSLTSHSALFFTRIVMLEFIDNQYSDLIKDRVYSSLQCSKAVVDSLSRFTKKILSRLFWPIVICGDR